MISVVELLNAARKFGPVQSDYRLARDVGVGDTAMYTYRHGGRVPADDVAVKLAQIAKIPAPYVLNCMAAARAKDPEVRAAFVAAAAALAGGFTPPGAGKLSGPSGGGVAGGNPEGIGGSSAKGSPVACAPVYTS
jgi:hypothetical protein